jgi:hypothetical protein
MAGIVIPNLPHHVTQRGNMRSVPRFQYLDRIPVGGPAMKLCLAWLLPFVVCLSSPMSAQATPEPSAQDQAAGDEKAATPKAPGPSDKAAGAEKPASSSIEDIAKEYYKHVRISKQRDKAASARSNRNMWKPPPSSPNVATGTVMDRFGQCVAGAEILIRADTGDQELGCGKTDNRGNFRVRLSRSVYKGLRLDVTAPGFTGWGLTVYGGIVDQPVRMDREIGAAYFEALAAEKDARQRIRLILELVGSRQLGEPKLVRIYSQIGLARKDLAAFIRSKAFEYKDDEWASPANRARYLLFFWQDEADADLINQDVPTHANYRLLKDGPSGTTIDEACRRYAEAHFARRRKTAHGFGDPVYGPDHDRALLELTVTYAVWGYSQYVVLTKRGGQWTVKVECDPHVQFDLVPMEPR